MDASLVATEILAGAEVMPELADFVDEYTIENSVYNSKTD